MEDQKITEMPKFESKVPENARRAMPDDQLWLADNLSVIDQKLDWLGQIAIKSHNTSISNDKQITEWREKLSSPMKIVWGIVVIAANVGIAYLVTLWLK